ncbi:MAG TPA: MMPL family transporter [Acidimicrobiales bacterium]|nr:MMPL family transporter [Acidimicrobiales bacterium]
MAPALVNVAVRLRWWTVVFWLLAAAGSTVFLPSLGSVIKNDNVAFLPSNAPSIVAASLASPFLSPNAPTGILVASRPAQALTSTDEQTIEHIEKEIRAVPSVTSVADGAFSADDQAFVADVDFAERTAGGGSAAKSAVADIRATFAAAEKTGLTFNLTGSLPILVDQQAAAAHAQNKTLVISVVLILALLIVAFRAVLAPLVALLPPALALAIASPVIAESTKLGVEISSLLQLLLTALVLGAGTDYGLFLMFRYRENLGRGFEPDDAIVAAGSKVGTSVTFSALTVIAALMSLLLASFGLYRGVGPGLAIGVAVVLLVELTFFPALLSIVGPRVFWPSVPRRGTGQSGAWGRVAGRISSHPVPALFAGVAFLGGLSVFLLDYAPSGFNPGSAIPGSDSGNGELVLEAHYGEVPSSATDVVFRFGSSVWSHPGVLEVAENELWETGQFSSITGALDPNGTPLPPIALASVYRQLGPPESLSAFTQSVTRVPPSLYDAYRASAQFIDSDGRTVLYRTSLTSGSPGSTAALQAIPAVRDSVSQVAADIRAQKWGVAGQAPGAADVSSISGEDVVKIVPVVVLALVLLLALVLRSVVSPLYLVASVVLSYMASLGLAVLIFVTFGHQLGVNFTLPFFMFIFIMALGEDYNILVMTRIREEAASLPLRKAVSQALSTTGTTVTTAGLILAGTFGVLALIASGQVRQIGTGLALGILLDTFLVRTLLVPSTTVLLGRWNWWPFASWHKNDEPDDTREDTRIRATTPIR